MRPNEIIDLHPWPFAWLRWAVAGAIALLAAPYAPVVLILVVFLWVIAAWTWTHRFQIDVADGRHILATRARRFDLATLCDVRYSSGGWGYPKMLLYFPGRGSVLERSSVSLGTYYRWGPRRWRTILRTLKPYVDALDLTDRPTIRYWEGAEIEPSN